MNQTNVRKNKQQQGAKSRKRNRRRRARAQQAVVPSASGSNKVKFSLSPCSNAYLRAMSDGFSLPTNVCVPDQYDVPSQKFNTYIRGTFAAGVGGFGCVTVGSTTFASDLPLARTTQATYPVGTVPVFTSIGVAGTGDTFDNQLPYIHSLFAPTATPQVSLKARLVACGVRARYIGTELNLGGRFVIGLAPFGSSWSGQSINQLLANPTTKSVIIDSARKWSGTFWIPRLPEQYAFSNFAVGEPFLSNTGALTDRAVNDIVIAVDGAVTGNTFEFEIVRYFEYIQIDGLNNYTPSHTDLPGLSAIRNVIERVRTIPTPSPAALNYYLSQVSEYYNELSGIKLLTASAAFVGTYATNRYVQRERLMAPQAVPEIVEL